MAGPACWMATPEPTKRPAPMTPAMAIMDRWRGLRVLARPPWGAGGPAGTEWDMLLPGVVGGGARCVADGGQDCAVPGPAGEPGDAIPGPVSWRSTRGRGPPVDRAL